MTCEHGRETVVRTGRPRKRGSPRPSLGRKADRIALTGEVRGFPRMNRRPYGRGHGVQKHGDSGGDDRGVSAYLTQFINIVDPLGRGIPTTSVVVEER